MLKMCFLILNDMLSALKSVCLLDILEKRCDGDSCVRSSYLFVRYYYNVILCVENLACEP